MKTYRVQISYLSFGYMEVEAENEKQAEDIARNEAEISLLDDVVCLDETKEIQEVRVC